MICMNRIFRPQVSYIRILRKNSGTPFSNGKGFIEKFWSWTTQPRPSWRESYKEAVVLFCVFGVTGSSSVFLIRPTFSAIGLKGSLRDGPWSYRILSILCISPIYACTLLVIGTLSGRHAFFANMSLKILRRFIPQNLTSKIVCFPATKKLKL